MSQHADLLSNERVRIACARVVNRALTLKCAGGQKGRRAPGVPRPLGARPLAAGPAPCSTSMNVTAGATRSKAPITAPLTFCLSRSQRVGLAMMEAR